MTKVLVDSDIIIDFLRTGGGMLPKLFIGQRDGKVELFLSTITVLELFAGKSSKTTTEKIHELIAGFSIIPLGIDLAVFVGELKRDHRMDTAFADLIVGATSLSISARLATRNRRHYRGIPKLRFYLSS
ncbi:PIN domain-containing protein [Candidatus Gottesmanbacteria bacterium]|nr:PIN domain-containing protein [Candidatus Gottesmanbacteria bacterium]